MKCVQKHFLKENLCTLQVFLCALISRPVCAFAQPRGNIGDNLKITTLKVHFVCIPQCKKYRQWLLGSDAKFFSVSRNTRDNRQKITSLNVDSVYMPQVHNNKNRAWTESLNLSTNFILGPTGVYFWWCTVLCTFSHCTTTAGRFWQRWPFRTQQRAAIDLESDTSAGSSCWIVPGCRAGALPS